MQINRFTRLDLVPVGILGLCLAAGGCSAANPNVANGSEAGPGGDPGGPDGGRGVGTGDSGGTDAGGGPSEGGTVPPPVKSTCAPAKVSLGVAMKLTSPGSSNLEGLGAGDFNGDAKADLVFADGTNVYVAFSNGDGTFATPKAYESINAGSATAVADFDGDGKLDFVNGGIAQGAGAPMQLWINKGDGTFKPPSPFDPQGSQTSQFIQAVPADFNADGKTDIVVTNNYDGAVHVVLNSGGAFTSSAPVSGSTERVAAGNLDSDNLPELVLTQGGNDVDSVCVILNKSGSLSAAPTCYTMTVAGRAKAVAVGDIDGDGKLDVVVAGFNNDGGVINVFRNTGNGVLDTPVKFGGELQTVSDVHVVDMNNDGHADVVAYAFDAKTVYVWLNDGKGTLSATPAAYPGGSPNVEGGNTTVGDFKGNGLSGVAVVSIGAGNTPNTVDVLSGTCLP
jgi:FG-GAP-like repeat